jgi:hypothetical protein
MDTRRAETELGWKPRTTALDAIAQVLNGLQDNAGMETPPLDPHADGSLQDLGSGVGRTG